MTGRRTTRTTADARVESDPRPWSSFARDRNHADTVSVEKAA